MKDIKAILSIIRKDVKHKQQRLKEYEEEGDKESYLLLKAEIKGIQSVLDDLEPIVY